MSPRRRRRSQDELDESLRQVAKDARLYAKYAAAMERGERNSPLETLYRVAAALNCPVADLLPPTSPPATWDRVIYCPGCDLADETTIVRAYERHQPCPNCGLAAYTIDDVLAARRRAVGPYE